MPIHPGQRCGAVLRPERDPMGLLQQPFETHATSLPFGPHERRRGSAAVREGILDAGACVVRVDETFLGDPAAVPQVTA